MGIKEKLSRLQRSYIITAIELRMIRLSELKILDSDLKRSFTLQFDELTKARDILLENGFGEYMERDLKEIEEIT